MESNILSNINALVATAVGLLTIREKMRAAKIAAANEQNNQLSSHNPQATSSPNSIPRSWLSHVSWKTVGIFIFTYFIMAALVSNPNDPDNPSTSYALIFWAGWITYWLLQRNKRKKAALL
jgi:hypothetical protein